jgi:phage gpG-like protein
MSVLFRITGDQEAAEYLRGLPDHIAFAVMDKLQNQAAQISARIKQKLSGEVLRVKTGRLRASAFAQVYFAKRMITMTVGSRGGVSYAALHEFGGVGLRIPAMVPTKARALSFVVGGARIFAMRTRAHSAIVPERSYIRSTLDEMTPDIVAAVQEGVDEAVSGRGR